MISLGFLRYLPRTAWIHKRLCTNMKMTTHKYFSSQSETICKSIRYSGPISVAQYMQTVLTNSNTGYYVHKDMLGSHGDYITSPELNQMFGELLGIWFINEWEAAGSPSNFRLVEFGPGRGTLASDIIQTFQHFRDKIFHKSKISFHFIEVSETLSNLQYEKLCGDGQKSETDLPECFQSGVSTVGDFPLSWHRDIESVPNDTFTFYLAHEFFDALPVHKFVNCEKGWREIHVDVANDSETKLRFVQLPETTLACKLIKTDERRKHVEICPIAGSIISTIAKRIENNGGGALIIDYGHLGDKEDTLRGFKDHKLNDVLSNVGEADITADVDFQFLMDSIKDIQVRTSGPITQQNFLKNMGIEIRLMVLLRNCKDKEQAQKLVDSYKIIMDEKHMGERFKVMALTSTFSAGQQRSHDDPVSGFYNR